MGTIFLVKKAAKDNALKKVIHYFILKKCVTRIALF